MSATIAGWGITPPYTANTNPVTRTRVIRTVVLGPGAVEIHYEARVSLDSSGVG